MAVRPPRSSKRQLEQDRRAKAERKRLRKLERADAPDGEPDAEQAPVVDQEQVLAALAALHLTYAEGSMSLDEFEATRDELTSQLHVD